MNSLKQASVVPLRTPQNLNPVAWHSDFVLDVEKRKKRMRRRRRMRRHVGYLMNNSSC
jgi:hypothetical protein